MSALSSTVRRFNWAGAALLVVAIGCGGSTESTPNGTGGSGGSGGSGATGGSGGSTTGGSGGASGGVPDATIQPDSGDVICNGTVCPPTMFGMMTIPACCTTQNTCGISIGMCFDPTTFDGGGTRPEAGGGIPDPNCPTLTLGGFPLGGCCMTDSTCGFVSQLTGGCISLEDLRRLNLPGVNLPEGGAMSCVYPPP